MQDEKFDGLIFIILIICVLQMSDITSQYYLFKSLTWFLKNIHIFSIVSIQVVYVLHLHISYLDLNILWLFFVYLM